MITKAEFIESIRPYMHADGEDLRITLQSLLNIFPGMDIDTITTRILEFDGVKMTDGKLGGIAIPRDNFK